MVPVVPGDGLAYVGDKDKGRPPPPGGVVVVVVVVTRGRLSGGPAASVRDRLRVGVVSVPSLTGSEDKNREEILTAPRASSSDLK